MLQDWLKARVNATPHKIALRIPPDHTLTFSELDAQVNDACAFLLALGVSAGDHIGVLLDNSLDYVALVFASMRLKLVLVPINTRLSSTEIVGQIERADCKILLTDTYRIDTLNKKTHIPIHLVDIQPAQISLPEAQIDLDAVAAIFHTSGTSSVPKGVCLTYGNIFYSAMASAYRIGVLPHDRWLCVLPLYHMGGISVILRSVLYGTAVDLYPRFGLEVVNRALINEPITLVSLVPTMLYRLMQIRKSAWNPDFRLVLLGGAAPTEQLIAQCVQENIPVSTTYGLTEAASQVATALPQQVVKKPKSVGSPLLFSSVRIVNDEGNELPTGQYGQIVVRGQTIMTGYYKNDKATQKTIINGELHTGDIGYLDEEGDLFIMQRRTDLIVTGGENVHPTEVEVVLDKHPAIEQAVVFGANDAEWGQRVSAVIQLRDNQIIESTELDQLCREYLAGYKCPRTYHFVDQLPLTASGKINRFAIREQYS